MRRHFVQMEAVAQMDATAEGNSVVHELATVLRSNGERVLSGETKLALTSAALGHINEVLSQVESHFSVHLDSHFLYDFIQKTVSLKLSRGCDTLQGDVNLGMFKSLKTLEIKRVPLHLVIGLQTLRPHLVAIDCHRCLGTLKELFVNCGGDRSSEFAWTELISAKLSFNNIRQLDNSLKLLPNLVSLNLSHNLIANTTGLDFLPQLKYLNLSYNLLTEVPRLPQCAQSRLLNLSLSHNNIETLKGLEVYLQLQHLDVTYNCILDHCCLNVLSGLKFLHNISLLGNPICYENCHRQLVLDHMHNDISLAQVCLDGQRLTKQEIAVRKSSGHNCRSVNENISINGPPSCSTSFDDCVDEGIQLCPEEEINVGAETEIVFRSKGRSREGKRTRKLGRMRDIVIQDPIEYDDDDEEGYGVASLASSVGRALDKDIEQTKLEIEQCHKQYGESWLVVGNNLSVLSPVAFNTELPRKEILLTMASEHEGHSKRLSQTSDDGIMLVSDDTAGCEAREREDKILASHKETRVEEMSDIEKDEDESADLNPFIVQREKPGTDVLETVMVIITETDIREKHVLTARTFQKLDLCSIQSITKFQINSEDGKERTRYGVRVTFNYFKKDKRERVYRLDDLESYQSFVAALEEVVQATTLKNMTFGALQCLKCSSQFSKQVAKQVVVLPLNISGSIPSSVGSSQGYLNAPPSITACPNCGSQLVVELEDSAFPEPPQEKLKATLPANMSSDERTSGFNCCNEVVIRAEVHTREHVDEDGVSAMVFPEMSSTSGIAGPGNVLRRNGSDITILSNPSQSSIVVVQGPGKVENPVCTSVGNEADASEILLNIYDCENTVGLHQPFQSPTRHSKVGSTSSDSLSGSVCTAMERSIAETKLKSPCGSPSQASKNELNKCGEKLDLNKLKGSTAANLPFSFADITVIDHRVRLFLDLEVVESQEYCLAVMKSAVVPYGEKEWTGLVVLTTLSVYVLRITGKENSRVETWMKMVDSHSLQNLRYVTSCLGNQGFRLEFARKNADGKCYTFLTRDADQTNAFVSYMSEKFQEPEFRHLQVEFETKADETMSAIAEQLFGSEDAEDLEEILLYMMCHWKSNDGEFEPVSVIVTESSVYASRESMLFPKPQLLPSSRDISSGQQQFVLLSKQQIGDLSALERYADSERELNVKFVNEDEQQEVCWTVRAETSSSLRSLVETLRAPWERLFQVHLLVTVL